MFPYALTFCAVTSIFINALYKYIVCSFKNPNYVTFLIAAHLILKEGEVRLQEGLAVTKEKGIKGHY